MLELSSLDVELDNEAHFILDALEDKREVAPQACDVCGGWTFLSRCQVCPGQPPLSQMERLTERAERGEISYEELDAMMMAIVEAEEAEVG